MSATTPSSGPTLVNGGHEDVPMATAIDGADKDFVGDGGNGKPGSSVMSPSRAGDNGGGGGDFRGSPGSVEGVAADVGNQAGVLRGRDGRRAVARQNNMVQRPRRHHDGKEGQVLAKAFSTARSFHDPSEIALRSRRLFSAYGGGEDGDGGRGSVSPRRAGTTRPTQVEAGLCLTPIWGIW